MSSNRCVIIVGSLFVFVQSCHKPLPLPPQSTGKLEINLTYHVDGLKLIPDSLMYINLAGNRYSVTRLQYYLSGFRFYNPVADETLAVDTFFFIDAFSNSYNSINISLPEGYYDLLCLYVGLPPKLNRTGALPPTFENLSMQWPDIMGGGYHFLKLEGYFKSSDTAPPQGYALHLGTNIALVNACIPVSVVIEPDKRTSLMLTMNINEWFRNPNMYDLSQKSYIMGDTIRMKMIAQNGWNVFSAQGVR